MSPFERFWALFGVPRDCLFPLPVEEKAISGHPRNAHEGLFPLPVEEKAISGSPGRPKSSPFRMILDAGFDPSRLPLPPWGDEKVTREAAVASSRLPFPSQGERKGHRELSQTPPGNSRGSQKRSTRPSPELPRDGLYPSRCVLFPFPHGLFSSLSYTSVCVHKRSVRASRRSRRALFPPLCGLRPEQKPIWTETLTKKR